MCNVHQKAQWFNHEDEIVFQNFGGQEGAENILQMSILFFWREFFQ